MTPFLNTNKSGTAQFIFLIFGCVLFAYTLLFIDLDPNNPKVTRAAAVALLMAIFWMTEAIPLAITALFPVVLFPALGIMSGKDVTPVYFNSIIFLFIGGFIVALAMEKWDLHKRIALLILLLVGSHPKNVLLGFMGSTWALSMWISNTAATMMMVSIALAVILKLEESPNPRKVKNFSKGLLLGVAYSASIGGIATPIGTPPNLSFSRIYQIYFPEALEISFANWFLFALPISFIFFFIAWIILGYLFCSKNEMENELTKKVFKEEFKQLGKCSFEETSVLVIFITMALLWLTRSDINLGNWTFYGWNSRLFEIGLISNTNFIDDGTIAICMATILFFIPTKKSASHRLMDWETVKKIPWHIILLFGGGFALASGFKESGLSIWIGNQLSDLNSLDPIAIATLICTVVTFITELTSNTGSIEMILPILAGISITSGINPLFLMLPATFSASCAFMLPVATPPNAIIFGTDRIRIIDMARIGILFNLIGIMLIVLSVYFIKYIFPVNF